jgi:ATP-dependent protease ClpP protease subunit
MQAAGTKGKRFSMPNARIMMHQPSGGQLTLLYMRWAQEVTSFGRTVGTVVWSKYLTGGVCAGGAMGSADEVNIQASELNRTMKVCNHL